MQFLGVVKALRILSTIKRQRRTSVCATIVGGRALVGKLFFVRLIAIDIRDISKLPPTFLCNRRLLSRQSSFEGIHSFQIPWIKKSHCGFKTGANMLSSA